MQSPDFLHIRTSGTKVARLALADDIAEGGDHVDAIQIIPLQGYESFVHPLNRAWYAASEISYITVEDCVISSRGTLQGITCFDGLVRDLTVQNCVFYLNSQHFITINGLLSGEFYRLHSGVFQHGVAPLQAETKCVVRLGNLRIGGAPTPADRVEIVSFSGSEYKYKAIDFDSTVSLLDTRGMKVSLPAGSVQPTNIANFDVRLFRSKVVSVQLTADFRAISRDAAEVCRVYQRLAKDCGDIV